MTLSTFALELAVLLAVALSKAVQMRRERDLGLALRPRWPVATATVSLGLSVVLSLPGRFPSISYGVDPKTVQLAANLTLMTTFFALQLLYLVPSKTGSVRQPLLREIVAFAATVGAAVALMVALAVQHSPTSYEPASLHRPTVATFYLVVGAYLIYVLGSLTIRNALYTRRIPSWPTRIGLAVTGVGCLMLLVSALVRGGIVVDALLTGSYPAVVREASSALLHLGNPVLTVGLVLPLLLGRVVATRLWLIRSVRYRQMHPLWTAVAAVFPEVVRPAHGPDQAVSNALMRWWRTVRPRSMAFRYTRRVVECRDGVARGQAYIPTERPGGSRAASPPNPLADRFASELVACGISSTRYVGDGTDLDADARELASLSTTLRARGLDWLQRDPGSEATRARVAETA